MFDFRHTVQPEFGGLLSGFSLSPKLTADSLMASAQPPQPANQQPTVSGLMASARQMGPSIDTSYVDPDYFENNVMDLSEVGQFNNAAPVSDGPYDISLPGLGGPSPDWGNISPVPNIEPTNVGQYQSGGLTGGALEPISIGEGMPIDPILQSENYSNNTPLGGSPQPSPAVSDLPPDPVFQAGQSTSMVYPHSPFPDMGGLMDFNQMALDAAGIQPAMQRNIQFAGPQNRMLDEMLAREKERAAQLGGTPEWIERIGDAATSPGGLLTGLVGGFGGVGDFFEGLF